MRTVGRDEPCDRRAGRRVETEQVRSAVAGRVEAAARVALVARRIDAGREVPAVGRASSAAPEVGAADDDVGARAGRRRGGDGEGRSEEERDEDARVHGWTEGPGGRNSPLRRSARAGAPRE